MFDYIIPQLIKNKNDIVSGVLKVEDWAMIQQYTDQFHNEAGSQHTQRVEMSEEYQQKYNRHAVGIAAEWALYTWANGDLIDYGDDIDFQVPLWNVLEERPLYKSDGGDFEHPMGGIIDVKARRVPPGWQDYYITARNHEVGFLTNWKDGKHYNLEKLAEGWIEYLVFAYFVYETGEYWIAGWMEAERFMSEYTLYYPEERMANGFASSFHCAQVPWNTIYDIKSLQLQGVLYPGQRDWKW